MEKRSTPTEAVGPIPTFFSVVTSGILVISVLWCLLVVALGILPGR